MNFVKFSKELNDTKQPKKNWMKQLKLLTLVRLYDRNDQCNADKSSFYAKKCSSFH